MISTVALNNVTWTDFTCPYETDNMNILNVSGQVMDYRFDKNDATTQLTVQDQQYALPDFPVSKNTPSPKYKRGVAYGSGKLQAGSGNVKIITG